MSEPAVGVDENFVPARGDAVYTVELDGEAVLLDEEANRLHLLNHTATLLWTLFDGHASLGELARELAAHLGGRDEIVLVDIVAITRRLADEGLLAP